MWKLILNEVHAYSFVTEDRSDFGDKVKQARKPESKNSLLFKPAAQVAFVKGILATCQPQKEDNEPEFVVKDALKIKQNWSMNDDLWKNVIIKASGAIDGGAEGKRRMALLYIMVITW